MGWANMITVLRAILTVVLWIVLAVATPNPSATTYWLAFGLFAFTAITDAVDGYLARRLGEVSVFGRIADPLVDKLLILGTMVMLLDMDGMEQVLPAWVVTVILAREVIVTALRGAVEGRGINFQALPLGKLKMVFQSFAAGLALMWGAGFVLARHAWWAGGPNLTQITVAIAVLLTVISGFDYGLRATRHLRA